MSIFKIKPTIININPKSLTSSMSNAIIDELDNSILYDFVNRFYDKLLNFNKTFKGKVGKMVYVKCGSFLDPHVVENQNLYRELYKKFELCKRDEKAFYAPALRQQTSNLSEEDLRKVYFLENISWFQEITWDNQIMLFLGWTKWKTDQNGETTIDWGNVDDVDDVGKIPAFLCQNKIITGWVWEKQYNFINDTKDIPIDLLNKQINPIFGE